MGQFPPCKASEAHPPGQLREKCPLRDRGHNRTCRSGRKISELRVPELPFYPCTSFGPAPHIADLIRCRHYPDMGGDSFGYKICQSQRDRPGGSGRSRLVTRRALYEFSGCKASKETRISRYRLEAIRLSTAPGDDRAAASPDDGRKGCRGQEASQEDHRPSL